ncbi:hypothetical protein ZOSMA_49G00730 [Zostera marina]|uniref:Uncharacterized protein n=1 Tax=Zostera marina TaxID=29655 RepID=A0A0K9P1C2_ZOSMR|nr:hypothetical protein ZOSMA_49G00730 [Zostera marina]
MKELNWIQKKILIFEVTFGSYSGDWWERGIVYMLAITVIWVLSFNLLRFALVLYNRVLT